MLDQVLMVASFPPCLVLDDVHRRLLDLRNRLMANTFTAEAGVTLRGELRELVIDCDDVFGRLHILFRLKGGLSEADAKCIEHAQLLRRG